MTATTHKSHGGSKQSQAVKLTTSNILPIAFTLADLNDPINVYLLVVLLTGVFQFTYVLLVGTFPFNAFLAGFLSCVTSFVLGVCLKKTGEFKGFLFAHLVLHLAVLMLIG